LFGIRLLSSALTSLNRLLRLSSLQTYSVGFPVFATSPFSCSTFRGPCNSIIYRQLLNFIDWMSQNGCRVYRSRRYWHRDSSWTCVILLHRFSCLSTNANNIHPPAQAALVLALSAIPYHSGLGVMESCVSSERHIRSCSVHQSNSMHFC
jgi:hypothetical protein